MAEVHIGINMDSSSVAKAAENAKNADTQVSALKDEITQLSKKVLDSVSGFKELSAFLKTNSGEMKKLTAQMKSGEVTAEAFKKAGVSAKDLDAVVKESRAAMKENVNDARVAYSETIKLLSRIYELQTDIAVSERMAAADRISAIDGEQRHVLNLLKENEQYGKILDRLDEIDKLMARLGMHMPTKGSLIGGVEESNLRKYVSLVNEAKSLEMQRVGIVESLVNAELQLPMAQREMLAAKARVRDVDREAINGQELLASLARENSAVSEEQAAAEAQRVAYLDDITARIDEERRLRQESLRQMQEAERQRQEELRQRQDDLYTAQIIRDINNELAAQEERAVAADREKIALGNQARDAIAHILSATTAETRELWRQEALEKAAIGLLDKIKSGWSKITATANTHKNSVSAINGVLRQTTSILSALGIRASLSSVVSQMKEGISTAGSYSEAINTLERSFERSSDTIQKWASENHAAFNLAETQAIQYTSTLGAILKTSGIAEPLREQMSTNLTKLSGDLASFYDKEISTMYSKIQSGIAGQTRPLLEIGINLSATNLNEWLRGLGISKTVEQMTQLEKTTVRYAYLLKSTSDIQGDFARTSGSFSNQVRTLRTEWQSFLSLLGSYAIPYLLPVIRTLRTILAYASAVVQAIAKIMGLEQYKATANIATDLSSISDQYDDINDSVNDTNAALKKQHELNKKNIKLLDLYELDFSTGDDSAGDAGGLPELKNEDLDLGKLLDGLEDYKGVDFTDFINVDQDLVDDIAQKIVNAFKWAYDTATKLWSGFWSVVSPFIEPIKTFVKWVVDHLFGGDWATFAGNLLGAFAIFKTGSWLFQGLASLAKSAKTVLTPVTKLQSGLLNMAKNGGVWGKSIAGILGGLESAAGGYAFGYSLAEAMNEGFNAFNLTGVLSGATMMLMGSIAAYVAAGLPGLIAAAIAGGIGVVVGAFKELDERAEKSREVMSQLGETVRGIGEPINELADFLGDAKEKYSAFENYVSTSEATISVNRQEIEDADYKLDLLKENITELPEGTTFAEYVDQTYRELRDRMIEVHDEALKQDYEFWIENLGGAAEQAGLTAIELNKIVAAMENEKKLLKDKQIERYTELKAKKATGTISDDEVSELEALEIKFTKVSDSAVAASEHIAQTYSYTDESIKQLMADYNAGRAELALPVQTAAQQYLEHLEALEAAGATPEEIQKSLEPFAATLQLALDQYKIDLGAFNTKLDGVIDEASTDLEQMKPILIGLKWVLDPSISAQALMGASGKLMSNDEALQKWFEDPSHTDLLKVLGFDISKLASMSETERAEIFTKLAIAFPKDEKAVEWIRGNKNYNNLRDIYEEMMKTEGFEEGEEILQRLKGIKVSAGTVLFDDTTQKAITDLGTRGGVDLSKAAENATQSEFSKSLLTGATASVDSTEHDEEYRDIAKKVYSKIDDPAEAKATGKKLVDDIGAGFEEALKPGGILPTQVDNMTALLNSIPTSFQAAFSSAMDGVRSKLNSFGAKLKDAVAGLGISSADITVTELVSKLSSKQIYLPQLAEGAVLYPNRPFMAVVGDQRRGVNVETPVGAITDAVVKGFDIIVARGALGGVQTIYVNMSLDGQALDTKILDVVSENGINVG